MPVSTLTCPKCSAVLKPAKPVPAGKKIKCPKCSTIFEARDDEAIAAKPRAGAAKKPGPAAPKKPASPDRNRQEDEDDGIATYAVVRDQSEQRKEEEDEDDDEQAINYVPDLSVKDPRGPAQATLVRPSNALMAVGVLGVVTNLLMIGWGVLPFIFTEGFPFLLAQPQPSPETFFRNEKGVVQPKEWKDLKAKEREELEAAIEEFQIQHWSTAGGGLLALFYNALICIGAVKMQNLESYGWSMTAAIMAVVPLSTCWLPLGFPVGIWALSTLRSEKVRKGFEYVAD